MFLLSGPIFLFFGAPKRQLRGHVWVVGLMLLLLSFRLFWAGSPFLILYGAVLIVGFAVSIVGMRPFLLECGAYAAMATLSGLDGIILYVRSASNRSIKLPRGKWLNVGLPLGAGLLFGVIFIQANPDLSLAFGNRLNWFFENLHHLLRNVIPYPGRLVVWGLIVWATVGLCVQ